MNRRDFLDPRHLAKSAAEVLDAVREIQTFSVEAAVPQELTLLEYGRQAMATSFELLFPLGARHSSEAAEDAFDEIDRLESQMTIFRDDSEISQLNRHAAHSDTGVVVEDGLFDLLSLAEQLHQQTEGAFDITTGPLTKTWGFYNREGRVPSRDELQAAQSLVGTQHMALDAERKSVRYLRDNIEINLGSIGKGYALDCAAWILRERWNILHAVLHGGNSSVLAFGDEPGSSDGWKIGIKHPWDPARRLAIVRLRNQGMGTSAATFQNIEYNGRKLGHIIDPRSGWPAEGIASATAIAPTAAQADALATAFFILGVEKTQEYCACHPDVGAVLLPEGENARPVIIGLSRNQIQITP